MILVLGFDRTLQNSLEGEKKKRVGKPSTILKEEKVGIKVLKFHQPSDINMFTAWNEI